MRSFLPILVALSFSALPVHAEDAALEAAHSAYAKQLEAARSKLADGFAEAVKTVAADGDLDAVKAIVEAKEAFEAKGTMPSVPAMKSAVEAYDAAEKTAREAVAVAYRERINALVKEGDLDAAGVAGDALKAIEAGRPIVVAAAVEPKPVPSDPVLAELQEAKDEYEAEYIGLSEELLADIDARILDLSKAGMLTEVAAVQEVRDEFESSGKLDETVDDKVKFAKAKFDRALTRHIRGLTASYRKAISRYRRAGDDVAQEKLEAELAAWTADAGRPTGSARIVNLVGLLDLKQDAKPGDKWAIEKGTLVCTRGGLVPKVVFPYEPPEEYDFEMEFMQPKLRNEVGLIMPNGDGQCFYWAIGGTQGSFKLQVSGLPQQPYFSKVKGAFRPGVKYRTRVQVRRGTVRTFVNGKLIYEFRGDRSMLAADGWHTIQDRERLALFTDDPTLFGRITVKEISGPGKFVREDEGDEPRRPTRFDR